MPGFDGTGPRGRGPMTGRGRGYCVLRLPRDVGESVEGLIGAAGRAVRIADAAGGPATASLRRRVAELERAVHAIRERIATLGADRR
jgi:hypothetical protein